MISNHAIVIRLVPPKPENAKHVHNEFDAHDDITNLIDNTLARLFAPKSDHSFESRNGNTLCSV